MTIPARIGAFLDLRPEDSFSAFTVAAHIGASRLSVAAVMARMANEGKLRRCQRGFYCSMKSPGRSPGSLPIDLLGTDQRELINPNPEERGNHEKNTLSIHGCGDPDA